MRVSYGWIKELLPELKSSVGQVEKKLTAAGIEVEGIEREADALEGIIVAEVRETEAHPHADKLTVCRVFDGEGEQTVVCGAPNVRPSIKVAFAPAGITLRSGLRLERRSIRGVESHGMLCSEAELDLGEDHDGIMEVSARLRPGRPLADALKLTDTVLELGVTPNRSDVLSHLGAARELAALFGLRLPRPKIRVKESPRPAQKRIRVVVEDTERCPKYLSRVITGVTVEPSPGWVRRRLGVLGVRTISNVVDATNLVLLELGQPLHAFDLARLEDRRIIVRCAQPGESIGLLDGSVKTLTDDDLVIADSVKPVALAGVMGGANSEVHADTVDILLEAAVFDPRSVRRTAKRHGMHTDASHRFERGVDFDRVEEAIDRCAQLIVEFAGGEVHNGRVGHTKRMRPPPLVPIRVDRAESLVGRPFAKKEIRDALTALGLKSSSKPEKRLPARYSKAQWFSVPSWRHDLSREEDLIEEVARLAGYDDLPPILPPRGGEVLTKPSAPDPEDMVREILVGSGFLEAISLAFGSPKHPEIMGLDRSRAVQLENPLGEETQFMRMSLLPALLEAARHNQDQLPSLTDLRLFEIGRTFAWGKGTLPDEPRRGALLLRGRQSPVGWASEPTPVDFFDLKGVVEHLLEIFRIEGAMFAADDAPWLHPRTAARVEHDGVVLGRLGEAHPSLHEAFGLEGPPVWVAELEIDVLGAAAGPHRTFRPLPRLPPAQRDLSFFVQTTTSAATVLGAIRDTVDPGLSEEVRLFDVYEGPGVPEGHRSLAVALTFRAADRTLTDGEVDQRVEQIVAALEGLGARLRDR